MSENHTHTRTIKQTQASLPDYVRVRFSDMAPFPYSRWTQSGRDGVDGHSKTSFSILQKFHTLPALSHKSAISTRLECTWNIWRHFQHFFPSLSFFWSSEREVVCLKIRLGESRIDLSTQKKSNENYVKLAGNVSGVEGVVRNKSRQICFKFAQRAAVNCSATHCNWLQLTATHCNSLQLTATHCNSLQLTATHDL